MCVKVETVSKALAGLAPLGIRIVTKNTETEGALNLRKFGRFILGGEGDRILAVTAEQCELLGESTIADTSALAELAEALPGANVESMNEIIVMADKSRVLDYGGSCIEQIVHHTQREEIWLMQACSMSGTAPFNVFA